jgi:hypothetical protein
VNRIHSPLISSILSGVIVCAFLQITAVGQSGSCPRFPVGSVVVQPEDLFSENGVLQLNFLYQTSVDQNGNVLYCFVNQDGAQSPTLHVHPGDVIVMTVTNNVPASTSSSSVFSSTKGDRYRKWSVGRLGDMGKLMQSMSGASGVAQGGDAQCGDAMMTSSSVNVHFHGTNTAPLCHQDEVVRTLINSGSTFQYNLQIPSDEPPGLYWYHPHVHGISEAAVQGGASGAIIVDGLENVNPAVAGMPAGVGHKGQAGSRKPDRRRCAGLGRVAELHSSSIPELRARGYPDEASRRAALAGFKCVRRHDNRSSTALRRSAAAAQGSCPGRRSDRVSGRNKCGQNHHQEPHSASARCPGGVHCEGAFFRG